MTPGLGTRPRGLATAARVAHIAVARPGRRAGADAVGRIRCAVSAFARTFSGCVISLERLPADELIVCPVWTHGL